MQNVSDSGYFSRGKPFHVSPALVPLYEMRHHQTTGPPADVLVPLMLGTAHRFKRQDDSITTGLSW